MQPSYIEIWVLQPPPLQNELPQVSSLGIYRTIILQNNFWVGYIAMKLEVTLVKNCNKPLLQKKWNKDFRLKKIYKKFIQIQSEK